MRKNYLASTVQRIRLTFLSNVVAYACRHSRQRIGTMGTVHAFFAHPPGDQGFGRQGSRRPSETSETSETPEVSESRYMEGPKSRKPNLPNPQSGG